MIWLQCLTPWYGSISCIHVKSGLQGVAYPLRKRGGNHPSEKTSGMMSDDNNALELHDGAGTYGAGTYPTTTANERGYGCKLSVVHKPGRSSAIRRLPSTAPGIRRLKPVYASVAVEWSVNLIKIMRSIPCNVSIHVVRWLITVMRSNFKALLT